MATNSSVAPIIAIVGPTASGKSALALRLAERYRGEIICADSRTVYRDMDIGTAKPTAEERRRIPHWGLDLVDPGEHYTAAAFQAYAEEAVAAIRSRGHVPIVVGGTGLYIEGLLYQYSYPTPASDTQRQQLEEMTTQDLHEYCKKYHFDVPSNARNRRHLIEAINRNGAAQQRLRTVRSDALLYGIAVDKTALRGRIHDRTEHMFQDGVVDETKMLGKKYGWDSEAMTGNIYPLLRMYIEGTCTLDDAKQQFETRDWQLAKRQMTWFRRSADIMWATQQEAEHIIGQQLSTSEHTL